MKKAAIMPATLFLLLIFILSGTKLVAQADSIFIELAQLDHHDLKAADTYLGIGAKVISGSRSEKDIVDLPFTVYVISGEEIRQNGYLTLTDVLKRLPGIRVSQPGSAEEGETFLMRGLKGNSYTKILINDVPIKPFVTSGMPIGAQLPIREAERIEVIYGPAATLYGADASAGVVNIIMKKSERPVYVQAAIGFGNDGHQNLDVMFSGRLGKGKRIVDFSVFGNFTGLEDRRTKYYKDRLYTPRVYSDFLDIEEFIDVENHPNFRGTIDSVSLGKLSHQSRALGIDVYYKKLHFFSYNFYRRDHSSIGLSPLSVEYGNPLNYFGEYINTIGLEYSINRKRFRFKGSFINLRYRTDPNSSYTYIYPFLNIYQHSVAYNLSNSQMEYDSLSQLINSRYYARGSRFSSARSSENNLQLLFGYTFSKYFETAWGANIQSGQGEPIQHFLREPNFSPNSGAGQLAAIASGYFDFSAFIENYINVGRWNAILGAQIFNREFDVLSTTYGLFFNPRIAIQYRVNDHLRLRSSTSSAFRYPSPYYIASTYLITAENENLVFNTNAKLDPEKTISADIGLRWQSGLKWYWDLSAYYTRTNDFVRYQLSFLEDEKLLVGYVNDNGSVARLYGIQSNLIMKKIIPVISLDAIFNFNYALGREFARSSIIGFDEIDELDELNLNGIRSLPRIITQLDLRLKPQDKITLVFENTFVGKSLTQNSLLYQIPDLGDDIDLKNSGYYTLDALVSYSLNKHISAYIRMNNVFNTKYAGLDATSDSNSLLFNPQSLRFTRFGVTYRID